MAGVYVQIAPAYTGDDLSGGGDRFVDDLVFRGDPDTVARKPHGHVDAGAGHVAVQAIGVRPDESALPHRRSPAGALPPAKDSAGR
ncbi:hypothetical protein ACFYPB_44495 [Streptomyces olivaceoviridis]|uniref:hypothetical protein n=1 Tax=Streptomyces olivaceoviridis TaxID=1921 RepID=UPI0036B00C5B